MIEQGSDAWHAMRLGRVTASRVADVVAKTKTGYSASRANYAAQLIAERLTGTVAETFTNAAMEWGSAMEADARTAYEFLHNASVAQVAFVDHPTISKSGASPDGLVGTDGLVELKCPNTATHIDTLLSQSIPGKYEMQMLWQMACTGRAWCDYVSYDPRLPEHMQLWVRRLHRNDVRIAELEAEVRGFLAEVDETIEALNTLFARAA